nr:hypothetical protein [Bradyrhizobium sp. Oc8]
MQPEGISCATAAYEQALHTLCVKDRDDPLAEAVARKVIEIVQTGMIDPAQIAARALEEIGVR